MSHFLIKKCPIISSNYGYAIVHAKISSQTQNKKEKKKIRKWEGIYACWFMMWKKIEDTHSENKPTAYGDGVC